MTSVAGNTFSPEIYCDRKLAVPLDLTMAGNITYIADDSVIYAVPG